MDMLPHMVKEQEGMYAYRRTFSYLAWRPTLLPNFLIFEHFVDVWSWFKGATIAVKMFKTLFCSKYTQKFPKNSNLLQSVQMTIGVLSPPPTVQYRVEKNRHVSSHSLDSLNKLVNFDTLNLYPCIDRFDSTAQWAGRRTLWNFDFFRICKIQSAHEKSISN